MPVPLLQLDHVTIRFGGLTAVNAVDFAVNPGELCGLIGPNGAGKTTVFNLITGVYPPTDGTITFGGRDNSVLYIVGESSVWSIQTRVHGFRHPSGMN